MITAIRYLFCTMIENCEGVDSIDILKELHSPVVFFVFKVFEDRLLQIYVDRSSRAKMQLFSFMLLWLDLEGARIEDVNDNQMWTRLLWMRIVGAIVLMYLMTWKVISVGLVGGITHSCLLRSNDAPVLAEAKIMGFLSGYVCIELGAWLSWYFALKAIALTPLLLVLLEGSLGEVSGLSGARWAALTLTQLLSIYLSYYSLPFFIVTSAIFAPFLATKATVWSLFFILYCSWVIKCEAGAQFIHRGAAAARKCRGQLPLQALSPPVRVLSSLRACSGHAFLCQKDCQVVVLQGDSCRFKRFEDDDDEDEDWYDGRDGDDC
eukprot:jgi/Bigna1/67403/fgenesh1_pg.3_\